MPRHRSEKVKEQDRIYREAHRAEAAARTKAWALANPEKRREMERQYKQANKEKIREQKKLWRKNNPEKHRAANQRWKINRALKICDFDAMLQQQGGLCAICRSGDLGRKNSGRLAIDHCHTTGAVRGLLCHRCNSLLGHAKDNIETLQRAIAYLEVANERTSSSSALRRD